LTKQGKIQEALTHFTEAVRTNPNYAEAHFNLGIALLRRGKIPEAIVYFNQALRINPKDARVHQNLGWSWQAKEKQRKP